jgi:hypothetical protein
LIPSDFTLLVFFAGIYVLQTEIGILFLEVRPSLLIGRGLGLQTHVMATLVKGVGIIDGHQAASS